MKSLLFGLAIMLAGMMFPCSATSVSTSTKNPICTEGESVPNPKADAKAKAVEDVNEYCRTHKSLNQIRFENFTEEDWLDNEYIRALRSYIDDFLNGEIEDETLEQNKELIKGKFVVGDLNEYMMGGLLISIMFVNNPEHVFTAWVYSDVDEETETVDNYHVVNIRFEDFKTDFTTEMVMQIIKEHPEQKVF